MKVTPPSGEANGLKVLSAIELEPVVDRGAPERRAGRDHDKLGLLLFVRNDAGSVTILLDEVPTNLLCSNEARHKLAAKQSIVRGQRSKDVSIQHIDEAFGSILRIPA